MDTGRRVLAAAWLAAVLLLGAAGVVHAGDTGGEITFRLVLRGDVIEGDAFSLGVNELGVENPTIISPGVRCGPGSEDYTPAFVACKPGTFEFVVSSTTSLPIGTTLEYAWARIPGAPPAGDDTVIYTDTISVTQHAQVFTVVYDYGGAALPNTATSNSANVVSLGIVAVIGAVLVMLAYAARRSLNRRQS
jgi:hypothetical protein